MLEVGWTEMLVIAIVMIVVVGPKDLPNMLRTFGRFAAKARGMAGDFQRQFNDALKEAELDDVKKSVDSLRDLHPGAQIRKRLNPFEQAAADVRAGVDSAMKPKPAEPPKVESADAPAQAAEPLKNGATDMSGVNGPDKMPPPVVFPAAAQPSAAQPSMPEAGATSAVGVKAAGTKKASAAKAKAAAPGVKAVGKAGTKPAAARTAVAKPPVAKPAAKAAAAEKKPGKAAAPAAKTAGTAAPVDKAAAAAAPAPAATAKAGSAKPANARSAAKAAAPKKTRAT